MFVIMSHIKKHVFLVSTDMESVKFSTLSYTKLILHAAKYPGQHIGGYLIGASSGDVVNVDDILPLCHGNPVGPLFELAGTIADVLYPAPQKVLGYYYANERVGSREVAPYISKVLATIQQNSGGLNLLAEIRSDLLDQQDNLCVEVVMYHLLSAFV